MTQQTARQLERAARVALDLLNNLTSEDFARGADKPARLALSAAIAAVDGEKASKAPAVAYCPYCLFMRDARVPVGADGHCPAQHLHLKVAR